MTPEEQAAFDKLKADLERAKAAATEATTRAETAEASAAQVKADAEVQIALIARGITDPDDRDTIIARYNRQDPEGRPDFGKWITKAEKADRIVSRIVQDVASAAKGAKDTETDAKTADPGTKAAEDPAKAAPLPGAPAGKTPPPPAGKGSWGKDRLAGASIDDVRKNITEIRKELMGD